MKPERCPKNVLLTRNRKVVIEDVQCPARRDQELPKMQFQHQHVCICLTCLTSLSEVHLPARPALLSTAS